jgi:hypothetical protein
MLWNDTHEGYHVACFDVCTLFDISAPAIDQGRSLCWQGMTPVLASA